MTEQISYIPTRLKSAVKGGYVTGSGDIIDDELQISQAQINAIVLGGSVTTNLTRNKDAVFVGVTSSITLAATISTPADSIKIFKNGVGEPIATGSGTSLSYADSISPSERGTIQYYAEFKVGGLTKRQPASGFVSTQAVDKMYTGAGTSYAETTMVAETSPHATGSFNKQITTADGDYIFIEVPDNFKLTKIVLVSTHETDLTFAEITSARAGYKAYKNNYPRGAETCIYKFTIANA